MSPVFYVIAILGCGDGSFDCREQRIEPARYESAAECHRELRAALMRNTDVPYPEINAACQQRNIRMVKLDLSGIQRGS